MFKYIISKEKMRDRIASQIIDYISEYTETDRSEITENSTLYDFPDCDSLDLVELLSYIEEKFGYYIPDEKLIKLDTIGGLIDEIADNVR